MTNTSTATPTRREHRSWRRSLVTVATTLVLLGLTVSAAQPASAEGDASTSTINPRSLFADLYHTSPGQQDAESVPTTSEQQHQLDFLLGFYQCDVDGNSVVGDSTIYVWTHPTLGGSFYQLELAQVKPGQTTILHGRWVIGWSAAEAKFVSFYYDENVMHGSSFSPGREGNAITFIVPYVLGAKGVFEVRDDFFIYTNDHFKIDEYLKINGQWIAFDVQDCHRV